MPFALRTLVFSLLLSLSAAAALAAPPAADLAKLDPRARVALARVRAGESAKRIEEAGAAVHASRDLDVFIAGTVSRQALEAAGARVRTESGGIFTAWVPADAIAAIAALPGVRRIEGSAPVEPQLDLSIPASNLQSARGPGPTFAGVNGLGVLLGVVDTGVDFDHGDFDDPAGNTRIVALWDQDDSTGVTPQDVGHGPYDYGSDWSPAQIDAGTANERDVYEHGHGTHVLGIAGGDGSFTAGATPPFTYAGVAPRADLLVVKTSFETTEIVDAVRYAFDRATARGQNAVVNLSLGSQFGPHDGTSSFESSLSALTGPGRVVVVAAGNDRARQYHAEVFAAGAGTDAQMFIANSAMGRTVAIDGYYESTEDLAVVVRAPDGTTIGPVPRGAIHAPFPGTNTPSGNVYVENGASSSPGGDPEVYVEINVDLPGQNMNGVWTFTFVPVALGPANGEVDLWRFHSGSAFAVFTLGNSIDELIVEPGNADSVITVAAYLTKAHWIDCGGRAVAYAPEPPPGVLASFSSPGPTRTGGLKPDLAAPGIGIASSTSFDNPAVCPSTDSELLDDDRRHYILEGTSMSAPHVSGVVALLEQQFGAISPSFAKLYLKDNAVSDAFTGATWNRDWGHGKLFVGDLNAVHVDPVSGTGFALAVWPNPAIGTATIEFTLPSEADVHVTVQDLQGREVAVLAHGHFAAGRHRAAWRGGAAGSGVYWVRYRAAGVERVRRMVFTR